MSPTGESRDRIIAVCYHPLDLGTWKCRRQGSSGRESDDAGGRVSAPPNSIQALFVCYGNGLQIWDCSNPTKPFAEVFSKRDGAVLAVVPLPTPSPSDSDGIRARKGEKRGEEGEADRRRDGRGAEGDALASLRPVVAVVTMGYNEVRYH